jgi:hypothetical protein
MPYAGGETPKVGDYVKNKWKQPGTVTAVHAAQVGQDHIDIRWDDGGINLLFASATEYTLISRRRM